MTEPAKKSKSRKVIKIIVLAYLLLLLMLCVLIIVSCNCAAKGDVRSDGFFQYIIVEENRSDSNRDAKNVIAIVGFTPSGLTQEVIEFPREINGMPVRYIGYRQYNGSWISVSYYHLESDNLKKIFIDENIEYVYDEAFNYWFVKEKHLEIMLCKAITYSIGEGIDSGNNNVYTYKSIYDSLDENTSVWLEDVQKYTLTKNQTLPANISFLNNYSNDVNGGYYRLDNIKANEKIPKPTNPVRSGYEFIGWYTEPECVNAWDFEVSPVIEDDTEFRLYAGWRTL